MAKDGAVHVDAQRTVMVNKAVPAAGTVVTIGTAAMEGCEYVALQAVFTYVSGGTTAKYYVQTSLDGGVTWVDVACFAFATTTASKVSALDARAAAVTAGTAPTDGTLADNTVLSGLLGTLFRVKEIVVGAAYVATIRIDLVAKG